MVKDYHSAGTGYVMNAFCLSGDEK